MRDVGAPSVVPEGFCARHCAAPNVPSLRLASTQSKLGWLRRFWAVALKSSFIVSVSLKVLPKPMSICTNFGPWKTFRPRVPKRLYNGPEPGYAGLPKSVFAANPVMIPLPSEGHTPPGEAAQRGETPLLFRLQSAMLPGGTLAAVVPRPAGVVAPGKPQPMGLLLMKIPTAGLFPL